MKAWVSILISAALLQAAIAGPEHIIKQRAKDVRDQNNTQQGVPSAPARVSSTPVQTAVRVAPSQPPLAQLNSQILNLKTNVPVTAAQIQQFAGSLAAAAQGASRPSSATLQKLSKDLLGSLSEKPLNANLRTRLVQNLLAVLNGSTLTAPQANNIIGDIQGVLQMGGTPAEKATVIAEDVRSVSAQVRKS
jgi:hypothetical protein